MTSYELAEKLKVKIRIERTAINEVLELIQLGLQKRAYLELGFGSMFDWLTKGFGYSNAAAQRRIETARLLMAIPEAATKLESGELNLTTMSKAHSVMRAHEKSCGARLTKAEKIEVVAKIESKSAQETERVLMSIFPEAASSVHQERRVVISETTTRHIMNLSLEVTKDLDRAKEVLSHTLPFAKDVASNMNVDPKLAESAESKSAEIEVVGAKQTDFGAVDTEVAKVKPITSAAEVNLMGKSQRATSLDESTENSFMAQTSQESTAKPSFVATKTNIIQDSGACCVFVDPVTRQSCESRYQIEADHIFPKALGGSDGSENLRALCRQHNILMAKKIFGEALMEKYQPDLV